MSIESAIEFWSKVESDASLQDELTSVIDRGAGSAVVEIAKANGFDVSDDDFRLVADHTTQGELDDADLANVSGGAGFPRFGRLGQTSRLLLRRMASASPQSGAAGGDPTRWGGAGGEPT